MGPATVFLFEMEDYLSQPATFGGERVNTSAG